MTAGHTPGPWVRSRNAVWANSPELRHSVMVAQIGPADPLNVPDWHAPEERRANACLIAAAPSMLDALRRCADQFGAYADLHRAKGTPEGNEKAAINEKFEVGLRLLIKEAAGE